MSRKIVFVGNCQSDMLYSLYKTYVAPVRREQVSKVASYEALSSADQRLIEDADLLIWQVLDSEPKAGFDLKMVHGKTIPFPMVTAAFLWPFGSLPHIRNAPLPYFRPGPYPDEYGDRFLNRQIQAGMDPAEAVAAYLELDVARAGRLDRLYELVMDRHRGRDEQCGFRCSELIEAYFRKEPVFLHPYHPNIRMAAYLAQEVFHRMGVEKATIDAIVSQWRATPFPRFEIPIHPGVCRHFNLDFLGSDHKFEYYTGERLTFSEFAQRYVSYSWNEPLLRGIMTARKRDPSRAEAELVIADLREGLAQSSGSAPGFFALGDMLGRIGRSSEAVEALRQAITMDPCQPHYLDRAVSLLLAEGHVADAEQMIRDYIGISATSAEAHTLLARVLAFRSQHEPAVKAARQAVSLSPCAPQMHLDMAQRLMASGDPIAAELTCRDALALAPWCSELYDRLAEALSQQNRKDEALAAVEQAIALNPAAIPSRKCLANLLFENGRLEAAEAAYRTAIALDSTDAGIWNGLARTLDRLARYEEALFAIRRSIELSSRNPGVLAFLAHLLSQNSEWQEAREVLTDAVRLFPNSAALCGRLAHILAFQGETAAAITTLYRALDIEPDNALWHVQLAQLSLQVGDADQAEHACRIGLAKNSEVPSLHACLSRALERQGRYPEALQEARAAARMIPHDSGLQRFICHLEGLTARVMAE